MKQHSKHTPQPLITTLWTALHALDDWCVTINMTTAANVSAQRIATAASYHILAFLT
jgi:hypothetical protein